MESFPTSGISKRTLSSNLLHNGTLCEEVASWSGSNLLGVIYKKRVGQKPTLLEYGTDDGIAIQSVQTYLAGGIITESMMWITPFDASTSVAMILASLTNAPLSVALIATAAPWRVFADLAATAASE
ncbi:hypothetical protein VN12_15525 [Pirellula sp. SH-Sr6A]|nr:hypothetical protein VN12_15525 [Pirellula sp. SH-Sr6A]